VISGPSRPNESLGETAICNSSVLDVAVGIVFTFLTVTLICWSLTEARATIRSWRGNTVIDGVKALVNDPGSNAMAVMPAGVESDFRARFLIGRVLRFLYDTKAVSA